MIEQQRNQIKKLDQVILDYKSSTKEVIVIFYEKVIDGIDDHFEILPIIS